MVTLTLPYPPSVNRIWRQGQYKGSVYLDPAYKAWRKHADQTIMLARRAGCAQVLGRFTADIVLDERRRRSNTDCDNRVKAILDALQRMLVIEDDALADNVSVSWGKADGAHVRITPCPA